MRLKRKTKIILWVIGSLLLVVFLWFEPWAWMLGQPRILFSRETTYLTEPVRADGTIDYAAALNAKYGAGVTPENNAAVPLYEATPYKTSDEHKKFFDALGIPPPTDERFAYRDIEIVCPFPKVEGVFQNDEETEHRRRLFRMEIDAENRPWSAEEFPEIEKWLQANREYIAKLEEASRRTRFYLPIVSKDEHELLLGSVSSGSYPHPTDFIPPLVMKNIHDGKIEDAIENIRTLNRLADLQAQGLGTHLQLISNGWRERAYELAAAVAFYAPLDAQQRKTLAMMVSVPFVSNHVSQMNEVERYIWLDAAAALSVGRNETTPRSKAQQLWFDATVDWNASLEFCNRQCDEAIAAYSIADFRARKDAIAKLTKFESAEKTFKWGNKLWFVFAGRKGRGINWGETASGYFTPNDAINEMTNRKTIKQRLAILSLAISAFHAEQNTFPEKLSELAPKYLAEIPKDLYGGGDFKYERRENGYRLYSIGPNEKDEGGKYVYEHEDDILLELPRPLSE